jgi:hypothetical protein
VANADTDVSALKGIATANTIIRFVKMGCPFKICVTIYLAENIRPIMMSNEKEAVIFNADAIIF